MNLKTSDLLTSETVILKVWPCLQLVGTTSTQKQRFVPFFTQIHLAIHQQFFDTPALLSTEGWDNFPHFLLNYLFPSLSKEFPCRTSLCLMPEEPNLSTDDWDKLTQDPFASFFLSSSDNATKITSSMYL